MRKLKDINILLVDNQTEIKEQLKSLQKFDYDISVSNVKSNKNFRDFVSKSTYSIIISEISLKNYSVLTALDFINQIGIKIPFIIYTNKNDTKTIISCFRKGATDYIIKPDITSLIDSIISSLTNKMKCKDENNFATLFDNALVGLYRTTPKGEITFANTALVEMLGFSSFEELKKHNLEEFVFRSKNSRKSFLRKIHKDGVIKNFETKWIKKDGQVIIVSESAQAVKDDKGKVLYYEGTVENITQRKNIEQKLLESNEELDQFFQNNLDLLCIADFEGHFRKLNLEWEKTLGYSIDELLGKKFLEFVHPDDVKPTLETFAKITRNKPILNFRNRYRCKDGTYKWIEWRATNVGTKIYAAARDITNTINFQNALFESEQKFKVLSENAPVGIFQTDKFGNTIYVNQKWCDIAKLSQDEAFGDGWLKNVHPDDRESLSIKWRKRASSKKSSYATYRFVHPDGKIVWVEGLAVPQKDETGKIVGYVGTISDITKQKEAADLLKSSEEKYRNLFESANDAIFLMRGEIFIDCNEMTVKMFGCNSKTDIINHTPYEFSPKFQPDEQKSYDKALKFINLALKGKPLRFYWKHKKLNGELFDAEVSLNKIIINNQVHIQAIVRDITKQKIAQDLLIESESRFRLFADLAPVGIVISDEVENVLYLSKRFTEIFGYTKDDFSNVEEWYKLAYPNEHFRNKVRENWNRIRAIAEKNNTHPPVEYPVVCKDGKTKIIDFKIASTGKLNFIVFTDITEKKESEKSLKTRLERINLLNNLNLNLQEAFELKEIISRSYQIIPKYLNVDRIGIFLYSKELDGLISEKYIGKTISKEIKDYQPLSIGVSGKCFREKKIIVIENCSQSDIIPQRFVIELNLKSTVAIPLKALGECIGVLRLDYTNSYHYFLKEELEFYELLGLQLGIIIRNAQSYSDQQIISKELKESNERYNLTIDASEQGIWDWNVETNEVFYSPQWKRQIGYNNDELENSFDTWVDHLHPDDKENCLLAVQNYLQNPVKHFILEFRFRHKDGSYRWIYNKASSVLDENGKVVRMFGAHTDITEQKLAQFAILDSQRQFKTLFDKAADAIFIADMQSGLIIDVNDAASKLMQLPKEKLIGLHQAQLHPANLSENVKENFKRHIEETTNTDASTPFETQVIRSDGNVVFVEILASQIYYKSKKCLMGTFRDISERKKAERELSHSYDLMKYVIENTQSSIAVHDTNMNYVYVSDRYYKDLKIKEKNIIGKNHYEIFPDLPQFLRDVHQRALKGEILSAENDMLVHKDGSIDFANWQCRPWYKADNSIGGIIIYIEVLTERRKAEFELKESEKKLRTFLETSIEGVIAADVNDKISYVNPRMTKLLGYSSEELMNKYFTELLFPEDLSYYMENQKIRRKGESNIFELKLRNKTGEAIWFLISATPIFDDNGNYTGSFGMLTDITEKKIVEDKIKSSEQRFRSIWQNSFEAMRLTNSDGIIVEVNEAFCKLFNKTREQLIGTPFYLLYSDHSEKVALEKFQKNFNNGNFNPLFETKIKTWYGEEKWVSLTNSYVYDELGNKLLLSIFRDITVNKIAEEEIRKLYRGIEHSPASVIITDREGTIEYVNPRFCEVTGYSLSEIIGKNPSILKSGYTKPEVYKILWDTISSGNIWKGEFLNKKKNGELYWELALISPIFNDEKQITHYIGIKEDITERKKLVEELVLAKDKAEESSRLKSNFLANMSHELRTPLIGILGFAELLMDDSTDKSTSEKASVIFKSGRRLLETLNLILDYSKVESEMIELKLEKINIINAINDIVNLHSPNAIKKQIELKFETEYNKFYFTTDFKLFNSILNNLIGNSIKFTQKGNITVIFRETELNNQNYIKLIIEDSGIGISKEKQAIIWEPFRQLSEGKARSFDGTGLGLTLVKKYVELLNGHIELESEVGKGSKFIIFFPL